MPSGPSTHRQGGILAGDGIVRAFDRLAETSRDRVLLIAPHGRATVGHVDDWARRIAHDVDTAERAGAHTLRPGDVVGLAAPNGAAFLSGFLALRRSARTVLLLDQAAPAPDRERALLAMGARALLTFGPSAPDGAPGEVRLESVSAPVTPDVRWPEAAVIKLTSGSTGLPRGVAVGGEALLADEDALFRTMALRDDDRLVAAIPMSHSYGFTTLALSAIVRGLCLVLPGDGGPFAALDAADAFQATVFPTVPAYLQAAVRLTDPRPWPESLRLTLTAGAPLLPATAARFRVFARRPAHVFYGASECGGICFDRAGDAGERGTVGTPVDGVRLALVDAGDDGAGLLEVRSAAVGAQSMPSSDQRLGDGRFLTSDRASWCDGEIVLHRRADRVIIVRGYKVDPVEVEQVLQAMPGVHEAAVAGAPASEDGGLIVRAVVACSPGDITAQAVAAWCRARLADHKVPRSIVLVEALPRTERGKLDQAALGRLAAAPVVPSPGHV